MELTTEIVGTVRGWSAEAIAGRSGAALEDPVPTKNKSGTVEERLQQLETLHSKGLLSDSEFEEKRAAISSEL